MPRLLLRALFFTLIAAALAACAARPKPVDDIPRSVEIRAVAVTAAADVSPYVLRNTQNQLKTAVRETIRPVPMPRAVMQIHIVGITKGQAYDGVTALADVNVVLADVENGMVILNREFAVQAFAFNQRALNNAVVEAIVSRIRVEYGLSQPVLRELPDQRVKISTRMDVQPPLTRHEEVVPVTVVPLKSAKRIGADADPLLNSRTKVEPVAKPAKAVILPEAKLKTDNAATAENALESGANAKVTIKPKAVEAAPADNEPCVETMDKKC
jgi:hypothetical protein